jgi:hypothetical protein
MTIWRSSPQGVDERLIHSTEVGGHARRGYHVNKWLRVEKNAIRRRLAPHAKRGLDMVRRRGLTRNEACVRWLVRMKVGLVAVAGIDVPSQPA